MGPETRLTRKTVATNNLEAYDVYLKANAMFAGGTEEDNLKAIELYRKVVELDPEFAQAWAKLSNAYSEQYFRYVGDMGAPQHAKAALDRALAINPNLPQAHNSLGYYLTSYIMDYDSAFKELTFAEKYLPDNAAVHMNFSYLYRRLGKWDKALERARLAMELNPRDPNTFSDMSDISLFLRNYDESRKYIDQAISLDSLNGLLHKEKLLGELIGGNGIRGAREVIKEVPKELDPVEVMITPNGVGLGALGYWRFDLISPITSDLPQRFSKSYKVSRRHTYWTNMGQIYELLGDIANAMIQYDSARLYLEPELEKYPDDFHLEASMGVVYSLLGRHEEAIRHSSRAKELLPISDCFW